MRRFHLRSLAIGMMISALILALATSGLAAFQKQATLDYAGIRITLNGSQVTPLDANGNSVEPFAIDGTTYLPVRAIATAMGLDVEWDGATNTVKLSAPQIAPSVPAGTYSRLSPAPIGTAQTIQYKSYFDDYNASVIVLGTIRGADAMTMVKDANMFNSAPKDGMEYIIAKIRVSINSTAEDKAISLSQYSFDAYSSDNVEYDDAFVVDPEPSFSGNVFAGGTLEGYVTFEVSVSDPAPKIVFGAKYDGSGGIWFSLV